MWYNVKSLCIRSGNVEENVFTRSSHSVKILTNRNTFRNKRKPKKVWTMNTILWVWSFLSDLRGCHWSSEYRVDRDTGGSGRGVPTVNLHDVHQGGTPHGPSPFLSRLTCGLGLPKRVFTCVTEAESFNRLVQDIGGCHYFRLDKARVFRLWTFMTTLCLLTGCLCLFLLSKTSCD